MEEIAIVGIACRFPGADDIDEFWEVLKNGEDHVQDIPKERWDLEQIDIPDVDDEWKAHASKSGLIKDYDKWDNKFFGISDSEAGWMDPQQCLALEVAYSALEDGGFTREHIKGTNTGVYIGCMNRDISLGLNDASNEFNNFLVTGIQSSIISNRLSYFFDIRGPSMTVDTACSSALVAIHLGCQAIRSGDCPMAICGGVNSVITPINYMALSKARMTSKTGKSHTFSKDADGYARGEGCGIVVLKSVKQAMKDGDKIWGVVMTGCNQDGKDNVPITAPSGNQQKYLLQKIYSNYNISPSDIQYIETHGTGTPIGDPTETNALAEFFAPYLSKDRKIPIGSVKTNIGHLESSAGTAGLIKVLLMMKNCQIVPSLHYSPDNGNPKINFAEIPLEVSTSLRTWTTQTNDTKLSCVNSFGFGGTNSHAIVKQIPMAKCTAEQSIKASQTCFIVAFSAVSKDALLNTIKHVLQKIKSERYDIENLSYTSLLKRSHYRNRHAVVANSLIELTEQLMSFNITEDEKPLKTNAVQIIFLFCGVGTIWLGMCQGFLNSKKLFKQTVEEIDKELKKYTKVSILETLQNQSKEFLKDSFLGPLAIFACQCALFRLWNDIGVFPDLIIGQSVGEVAAAYAAGCLTLPEAVQVTYHRSFLSAKAAGGKMLVVGHCNIEQMEKICENYENKVCIAVYSSKETCVVSGDADAIDNLKETILSSDEFRSVLSKELDVTCAYHSYHMTDASKQLELELKNLNGRVPNISIISTLSGKHINGPEMGTAEYWSSNLLKPVLLREAVAEAIDPNKKNIFVEVGPKPVLRAHLKKITNDEAMTVTSCNNPEENRTFTKAIAELYMHNVPVTLDKLIRKEQFVTYIPRYKFNRSGKLLMSNAVRATLQLNTTKSDTHPFVSRKPLSDGFKVTISEERTPYVYEHVLDKQHIAPGAIHAEIGLSVSKVHSNHPLSKTSISLHFVKPLGLGQNQGVELDINVSKQFGSFEVKRKKDIICKGHYSETKRDDLVQVNISEIKQSCPIYVSQQEFYDTLRHLGFEYGYSLTVIENSWRSDTEYIAEMNVPDVVANEMHDLHLHPCILDGVLQTLSISWIATLAQYEGLAAEMSRPIPIRLGALTVRTSPRKKMYIFGRLMQSTIQQAFLNLLLLTESGEVVAAIENYEVKNVAPGFSYTSLSEKTYGTRWLPVEMEKLKSSKEGLQKTMCICLTSSSLDCLEPLSKDDSNVMTFLDVASDTDFDSNKMLQKIQKAIANKNMKWGDISDIVYFPGFRHFSKDLHPDEIYQCIKVSCLILLKLLQMFLSETIDIPIYVITEKAQPNAVEDHMYNVTGSELWGMCRCLVRERTYSSVRLVDVTEVSNVKLLPLIIENTRKEEMFCYTPEFKCSNDLIYMNQIIRLNDESQGHRMNPYNEHQQLELRSTNFTNMENLFFIENVGQILYENSRQTKIDVEMAAIVHRTSPVTATMAIDDPDPWKSSREDGHAVLATEFCGRLTAEYNSNERSASCFATSRIYPSNSDIKGRVFVSCFPSTVGNIVYVPKTCLIPVEEFKGHYRPGIMHECILYLAVLEEIKVKIPIGIIYDKSMGLDINLLQSILNATKRRVVFLLDVVDFIEKFKMEGQCQIVLLMDNTNDLVRMSTKLCVLASRIIAPSQFINKSRERILRQRLSNANIFIINFDDIMSERRLEMQVKALRSLLKKDCITSSSSGEHDGISIVNFNLNSQLNDCIQAPSVAVKTDKSRIFNKSAGYLIVGGLTGLGWEIVNLIAAMGGGCIATIARSIPTEDKLLEIKSLEEKNVCRIISLHGDVANYESLKQALDRYQEECPLYPLKGVFHGAAVLEDAIIVHMTEEKFEKVLKPKVLGTLNLHSLTQNMNLDYFVLQSSITSVFGNSGQTNYGAGNAFMDTFAFYRRSIGISGQTINWGALHLGLLTAYENVERHLNSQGYQSLKLDEIMECFLHALCKDFTQMVYGIFKWETIVRQSPDMIHLTSKLLPILTELNLLDIFTSKQNNKINIDLEEIIKLPEEKRYGKIIEALKMIVADAFAIELTITDENTSFVNLGIDSMKGMSLINNIYEYLSCRIPVIAVLEQEANIESIAKLILQQFAVSSDVSGIVPVDQLLKVKNELRERCVDLNFIENELFKRQDNDSSSFNFVHVELNIFDETVDFKIVKKAFSKLLSLNSFLDSFYIQDDDAIGRVPGEIMNQDQEEESSTETIIQSLGTMQQGFEIDRRFRGGLGSSHLSDHMSSTKTLIFEGRVVKIIFENQQKCSKITIMCDRMLFDKESTLKLAFQFMSIIENESVTVDKGLQDTVNAVELEEAFNRLKDDLDILWPMLMSQNIKPVMFKEQIAVKGRYVDIDTTTVILPLDLSKLVHSYLHKNAMSITEFFISIYQLFLHFTSNNDVVSVASYVNVRSMVNGSNGCGGLENCIPFIAEITNDTWTIASFLLQNTETIRKCTRLSLLPWSYMESLFTNTLTGVNAFMHCVVVDQTVKDENLFSTLRVKLESITCLESRFHTAVHIKDQGDEEPILMSMHSNPQLVEAQTVTKILEGLQKMMEAITEIENLTVKQMKTKFQTQSVVNENDLTTITHGEEEVLYKGVFQKETTYGWDHQVLLRIKYIDGNKKVLQWNAGKKSKEIEIAEIQRAKCSCLNGMVAVTLETDTRHYCFKTADKEEVDVLWKYFSENTI